MVNFDTIIYPALRSRRIFAAFFVFVMGWILWLTSMFITATSHPIFGPPVAAESTFSTFVVTVIGAIVCFPNLVSSSPAITTSGKLVGIGCFAYCVSLALTWWPILVRSTTPVIGVYRLMSFALLFPWYFFLFEYHQGTVLGFGYPVWCVANLLIGLSVWLPPARIPGEPFGSLTVLVRAANNQPVLTFGPPLPEPAFPVVLPTDWEHEDDDDEV